jgi:endonuclease III
MAYLLDHDRLCTRLREYTGDGAHNILAALSEVNGYSKCVDFFVREALRLDVVPVDRHVKRVLRRFRLGGVKPPHLSYLIRQAGFEPRLVARALYQQGLS